MEPHAQILAAILGAGVAVAGPVLRQGQTLREDIKELRREVDKPSGRLGRVEQGLAALKATVPSSVYAWTRLVPRSWMISAGAAQVDEPLDLQPR